MSISGCPNRSPNKLDRSFSLIFFLSSIFTWLKKCMFDDNNLFSALIAVVWKMFLVFSSNFSLEVKQKYFFTFFSLPLLHGSLGKTFPLYFFLVLLLLVVYITLVSSILVVMLLKWKLGINDLLLVPLNSIFKFQMVYSKYPNRHRCYKTLKLRFSIFYTF